MIGDETLPIAPIVADSAPRLQLVVQSGSQASKTIPCRRIVTLLGTRPGCKIKLQHASVSPVHLALVNNGAKIFAVDLLSHRGAKLNDLKMEQEALQHGDVIDVDPWEFRIEVRQGRTNGQADAHPIELDQTPDVVAMEHLDSGRILQLNREICVIGRRSGCDIHIADDRVSRVHALVLNYFGHPAVCDLLSETGTFVNDERVTYRALKDQDIISIGESRFRVRLVGSKVGEPASKTPESAPPAIQLVDEEVGPDLVDIQAVEGSQRWHVADSLEKTARSKKKTRISSGA
ncbi:MAG: FHA domain-containing protein [Planctomycetes bacterium]|nr:FHA domain-containing protein [Planctomycetota bacterium]